jgi:hypothetical protein
MNPRHRDWITESLIEHTRRSNFIRIFPAPGSDCYDKYFQIPRISNKLLYKFLYGSDFIMELQRYFYPQSQIPVAPPPQQPIGPPIKVIVNKTPNEQQTLIPVTKKEEDQKVQRITKNRIIAASSVQSPVAQ